MIDTFRLERVKYVPMELEAGILYVAAEFDVAVHLCACGCGTKVTTPLGPAEWQVADTINGPTVMPSIGNWQLPCRSHYLISGGSVRWAGQWSDQRVSAGRNSEQRRREAYYAARAHDRKWWVRLGGWIRGLLN